MPYASNGVVSSDLLPESPDSIEISVEQYRQAIEGMSEGLAVRVDGGVFSLVPPVLEETTAPTEEELKVAALAQRDQLLALAAVRISPLQDAVDLGRATEAEKAALVDWMNYRVDLNRIEQQAGYPGAIVWPEAP